MKSNPFKVGDRVTYKPRPDLGEGKTKIIHNGQIVVKWVSATIWDDPLLFEFAETPIQRMKRLYERDTKEKSS